MVMAAMEIHKALTSEMAEMVVPAVTAVTVAKVFPVMLLSIAVRSRYVEVRKVLPVWAASSE